MDSSISCCSVIIVGAGISGIMSAKVLADNGTKDFLILEASDRIGGRLMKHEFAGLTVESGAGWVAGVGGNNMNPIWELAKKHSLRTCYSDYSNAIFNIYDPCGARIPGSVTAASYDLAVDSANRALAIEAASTVVNSVSPLEELKSEEFVPSTPLELAIDYILHDFEMAEVEPIPTFTEFGDKEFMVADDRGYEHIVRKLSEEFLQYSGSGHVVDDRLKLNKVVTEIQYTNHGATVKTEDGSIYMAKYVISSVSLGVLQSDLIKFNPPLPCWKRKTFFNCDIRTYTKIFLKFPTKFWPTGDGTEFFLYAHPKRGYYTFWQHMENAYPGSNILVVTVTDEESKRVEAQSDEETKAEAMAVLRKMFGDGIPEAEQILVPKWWSNRFQRGSYSNYPILVDKKHFRDIRAPVGPVYFTGEHTSEKFNGYVHGGYLSGIDTANMVVESMKKKKQQQLLYEENGFHSWCHRNQLQDQLQACAELTY